MSRYWVAILIVLPVLSLKAQDNVDPILTDSAKMQKIEPKQWPLGVQSGVSFMWADTEAAQNKLINDGANAEEVDAFYKQIRRGYYFSADAHRLFSNTWGLGLKYSLMASYAEQYLSFHSADYSYILNTNIVNREYVNYAGVSFYVQQWFRRATALQVHSSVSFGYTHYRNEFETDFSNYYFEVNQLATGNTFGGSLEAGIEYFPAHWISIGAGIGCFLARFDKLDITNGTSKTTVTLSGDERKNVSRLDFFAGVRIYLK